MLKRTQLFIGIFCISCLIFFIRNPDAFFNPVFYAEDGRSYVGPILSHGFFPALFEARADYLVLGNIVITGIAILINQLIFGSNVLNLPQIIAITSYSFLAFVAALPILLLHQKLRMRYLILLALAVSFFPLGGSDFEVIGRILNLGYAFVYLAFILIAYRNIRLEQGDTKQNIWIFLGLDICIWVCAATNPVVFMLQPIAYFPYLKKVWKKGSSWQSIFRDRTFLSLIGLSTVLCIQLFFMLASRNSYTGGLDSSWTPASLIEMVLARSILYPVIYPFYRYMNDVFTVLLLIAVVALFIKFANPKNYEMYWAGVYSLAIFSLLAVVFRPGLTSLLNGYSTTWPDRYYYGQNLLSIFLVVLLVQDIASCFLKRSMQLGVLTIAFVVLLSGANQASSYGNIERHAGNLRQIGTFEQNLMQAVARQSFINEEWQPAADGKFVFVPIYPTTPPWAMMLPRHIAEQSTQVEPVANIANPSALQNVSPLGNGGYQVTDKDPGIRYDLQLFQLNGTDADILGFDFACLGSSVAPQASAPTLEIYWGSKSFGGPDEQSVIRFVAPNGPVRIPLDTSARWHQAHHLRSLRIDVQNPEVCPAFSVKNAQLLKRTPER
ncbi:hypothetical protein ACQ4M4_09020 [Leptolyngbya sp. AN02str]|uniref:hypothetical protein n=1 Tax=Leptolyngbya sp. AN02str TaxID=3423363 RepID=UPI003D3112C8